MGKYAKLNIIKKQVDDLEPHPLNPHFHPEGQIEKLSWDGVMSDAGD